ncbi:hypothetical protein [Dermatophilus congolensis]|uniref:hypothetical protein n=1 Tax=Dermatophilus congolensis TaxID=1863 RepID=UPI001AAF0C8E|nr:hypothetical protein [Dermatophilus congolensis]MBO3130612.1 hypothetical protein [Dermatophilus congolensis]MBO3130758.1 hypothetical protein [Dermatophilus congolensis]MBO3135085.1 hypothetical protein [Dermatophilus congolensis]MBO3137324.1 hypothetical protein [Dermatophilus congolensis]MBO3139566.1 hypothetical protein [Dermatophilus congolensis]
MPATSKNITKKNPETNPHARHHFHQQRHAHLSSMLQQFTRLKALFLPPVPKPPKPKGPKLFDEQKVSGL